MQNITLNNILKINMLENELEHEKAASLYLKLRKLEKEDKNYSRYRKHLSDLLHNFEQEHWQDENSITLEQINESDLAEKIVQAENEFYYKRKELIRNKLKEAGINQSSLAKILGHRKGYMSELLNGLRSFSKEDLVIISKLFNIKLEYLVPPFVKPQKVIHIKNTLKSIPGNKLNFNI